MHQFHKLIWSWNSTCFGEFVCPSSGVYSPYTQQWYMSYRFVDSLRAGAYAPARKLSTVHLVGFIINIFFIVEIEIEKVIAEWL
jgi:hypothetical protein